MLVQPSKKRTYSKPLVPYDSYSSLKRALPPTGCLAGYREFYLNKWKDKASPSLIFGRAYHGAIEDILVEKMHHQYLMGPQRVHEIFQIHWAMEMFLAERDGMVWAGAKSPEDYIQKGLALMDVWLEKIGPTMDPLDVEMPFLIELSGLGRALYGRIDYTDKKGILVDHKTSVLIYGKEFNPQQFQLQMGIYCVGWQTVYGTWPASIELHRAIMTGPPDIIREVIELSPETVQEQIDTVVKPTIKRIEEAYGTNTWPCTCGKHEGDPSAGRPTEKSNSQTPA